MKYQISKQINYPFLKGLGKDTNSFESVYGNILITNYENLVVPYETILSLFNTDWRLHELILWKRLQPVYFNNKLHFFNIHYLEIKNGFKKTKNYSPFLDFKPDISIPKIEGLIVEPILFDNRTELRSYFLTINEVLSKLNICLDELTELVAIEALRPILLIFEIRFYSFQIDEILDVLEHGKKP